MHDTSVDCPLLAESTKLWQSEPQSLGCIGVRLLKIALVLEPSGGGSGRHVLDLAEALAKGGHDVCVFWSSVRAEDSWVAQLRSIAGVRQVDVMLQRAVGLHDIKGFFDLRRALIAHGPFDVVHAHSSKAGALVRMMSRRVAPIRVYTPHALRTMDPDISGKAALVFGKIEALLALRGDPIIAVSAAEKAHAETLGISAAQVRVVPNGAAPKTGMGRDAARATFGAVPDDYVVGFIGRMVPQKDPLRFVDSVARAAAEAPNLKAVMMGDGPLMAEAQARAKDAPITFLGWCDAPALVAGLDTLCVTSRYEALAYSFLEALHAGVPIISAGVGGVEECVIEGETGYVVPVDADAEDFAKVLKKLADQAQRVAFSKASTDLASLRTVEAMAKATVEVYRAAGAPQGRSASADVAA